MDFSADCLSLPGQRSPGCPPSIEAYIYPREALHEVVWNARFEVPDDRVKCLARAEITKIVIVHENEESICHGSVRVPGKLESAPLNTWGWLAQEFPIGAWRGREVLVALALRLRGK